MPAACSDNMDLTLIPANSLANFNGISAAGNWTLTVTDAFDSDGGTITAWGLEICTLSSTTTISCDDIPCILNIGATKINN